MSLDRELRALGATLEWPDSPDVAAAVIARLDAPPRPRPRRAPGRRTALALAVLVAAVAAVLAVPPARTAILDWLGIGGAQIVRVDELPAVPPAPGLDTLGAVVPLDVARDRAGFRFLDPPDDEPAPDEVLRHSNPLRLRGLTTAQRIHYLSSLLHYTDGLQRLVSLTVPPAVLFTGTLPLEAPQLLFLLLFLPQLERAIRDRPRRDVRQGRQSAVLEQADRLRGDAEGRR